MADGSEFSVGDIFGTVGNFVGDVASQFGQVILDGAKNKAVQASDKIQAAVNGSAAKLNQYLALSRPDELQGSTMPPSSLSGKLQYLEQKILGLGISTWATVAIALVGGIAVWMFSRSR